MQTSFSIGGMAGSEMKNPNPGGKPAQYTLEKRIIKERGKKFACVNIMMVGVI
jgi:hypothetical protein